MKKNINNQLKNKALNFVAALVCGAIGGNVFMYSVGQIFILKVSSLKNTFWSALSMDVFWSRFCISRSCSILC